MCAAFPCVFGQLGADAIRKVQYDQQRLLGVELLYCPKHAASRLLVLAVLFCDRWRVDAMLLRPLPCIVGVAFVPGMV